MARLTAIRLFALAGLLVVVIVDVVLFSHLLPTMTSSLVLPGGATTSANTAAPKHTARPAAGPTAVVTKTFSLEVPAGFQVADVGSNDASLFLGDHATTDSLDVVQVSAKRESGVAAIDSVTLQSRQLGRLETVYGTVGTCVASTSVSVGDVDGTLTGYVYAMRRTTTPGPVICDAYWFGTNSSENVAYSFEDAALQSDYSAFAPLAARVRDSVTWLI